MSGVAGEAVGELVTGEAVVGTDLAMRSLGVSVIPEVACTIAETIMSEVRSRDTTRAGRGRTATEASLRTLHAFIVNMVDGGAREAEGVAHVVASHEVVLGAGCAVVDGRAGGAG